MIIALVGESGCGKSTAERALGSQGYRRAISHTTRPMREGEINGVDYYFVTREELDKMDKNDELVELNYYNGNYYALSKKEIEGDKVVVVIEPRGLEQLKERKDLDLFVIYLRASETARLKRMVARGDSLTNAQDRIKNDKERFVDILQLTNIIVDTDEQTIDELVESVRVYCELHEKGIIR